MAGGVLALIMFGFGGTVVTSYVGATPVVLGLMLGISLVVGSLTTLVSHRLG